MAVPGLGEDVAIKCLRIAGMQKPDEAVREAIAGLNEIQRTALELAFFAGLTHVEVAEQLGIPLGTAKTRIRTALLKLRDALGDSVSEHEDVADAARTT